MMFILSYSSLRDERGYWVCMSCFIVPPQCGGLPVGQVGRRETAAVASSTVRWEPRVRQELWFILVVFTDILES